MSASLPFERLAHLAGQIWEAIIATRDTSFLNRFILITFADLKKYKYFYWFAFPAFVSKPAWEITGTGWKPASDEFSPQTVCLIHRIDRYHLMSM
jgi:ubiquitin-like modifier-activating enzyme ATG7